MIPERIFPPYEPPLQLWWQQPKPFPFAAVLEGCMSVIALSLALLAIRLLML
jgi:hypothetical protein